MGQRGGIVSKDDAVFALLELKEVEQPLFCCETVEEIKVSLAVLHAILALGVLILERKGVVGDAVLLQQDAEDFVRLLGLKDAGVLAQTQSPQGRFDLKAIAGAAKTAIPLRKLAHYPAHPALQLAVVPHQQLTRLVQHGAKVDVRLLAGHLQVEVKGAVQAFIELEARDCKGTVSQCADLDGKL